MDTSLPHPALAAAAPVALQQPVQVPAIPRRTFERISDTFNSVVFYGLLAFGVAFPFIATTYALIVL